MKQFTIKVLIVSLAVFMLSLVVKDVLHVGDTIITQETSKNYNGYLTLDVENQLIDSGAFTIDYSAYGDYSYHYNGLINDEIIIQGYMYLIVEYSNDPYLYSGWVWSIRIDTINSVIDFGDGYGQMYSGFIDGNIIIRGQSNYEVTP